MITSALYSLLLLSLGSSLLYLTLQKLEQFKKAIGMSMSQITYKPSQLTTLPYRSAAGTWFGNYDGAIFLPTCPFLMTLKDNSPSRLVFILTSILCGACPLSNQKVDPIEATGNGECMAIIELENIRKSYADGNQVHHVLNQLELSVEPNEFVAILALLDLASPRFSHRWLAFISG